MKKQQGFFLVGALLLFLFTATSVFTFQRSRESIEKGYLASEGNAALNFAVLTAANIRLSDAQVEELKQYSYAELMASDENERLRSMMSNASFSNKVDYAYIMIHLEDSEVKYTVTAENSARYDAPIGTKLDIMWLLDVNVSDETSGLSQSALSNELSRYSYYIEQDAHIFAEAPTYIYNASEWGDHICGYAPVYTTQGSYIGVVGVELQTGDYVAYCDSAVFSLGILMVVSLLLLSFLFLYLYMRFRTIQLEKVYLDPLTRIYNRNYYSNRFIREMNRRKKGSLFALLILDVDWFKKVNDTFGHEVGDEVLTELAEILVQVFGKESVVRFGGEEFVAGLWIEDEQELREKLDELYSRIGGHRFTSCEIDITVSLGCSYYKSERVGGWLISGLLRAADGRLYEAKESGRKKYLLEPFDKDKDYKKTSGKATGGGPEKATEAAGGSK